MTEGLLVNADGDSKVTGNDVTSERARVQFNKNVLQTYIEYGGAPFILFIVI
jgi:hypothetical protein